MTNLDHPIFLQSVEYIRSKLSPNGLDDLQQAVLERLIHASGDFALQSFLRFSSDACENALTALNAGALILTDTAMASAAVAPMANRTLKASVKCALEWAPRNTKTEGLTRTALGMKTAWLELTNNAIPPIVLIGSSPTSLQTLLDMVSEGCKKPSVIIGMPVGFIGVTESKLRLLESDCSYILLEGSRGGASLVAATINALLREASLR